MLNKAYSNFILIRDAKDTADFLLEVNEASKNTIGIPFAVQELHKHRFHLVLGSSTEVGRSEQGSLIGFDRGELEIGFHLGNPIVEALAVSIVEIGFSDLSVVLVAVSASSAGSTNLARCTSRGVA